MLNLVDTLMPYLPSHLQKLPWRSHPLDGKLLLFDRDTGTNVLFESEATQLLQRIAPRSLLIALTNACNLTCNFCYRDLKSRSIWNPETVLKFCQDADRWGVLEIAFGGGEPMLFPHWPELICDLYNTTGLCINFTTNGTLLSENFFHKIAGRYGQIRVSLYDDNHWPDTLSLLTRCNARFGVNWLITPRELDRLESKMTQLLELGVRDFLLLSYKGASPGLHLNAKQRQRLTKFINFTQGMLGSSVQIKLDICWGDSLPNIPRLFPAADCEAGDDFLSITSDFKIKPCSFTPYGVPLNSLEDVKNYWQAGRAKRLAAPIAGCARLPERGLLEEGLLNENFHLAAI